MNFFGMGISGIVEAVGKVADDLITSDEERLKIGLEERKLETGLVAEIHKTNQAEANSGDPRAMWRPLLGKICAYGVGYAFIGQPILTWFFSILQGLNYIPLTIPMPPTLEVGELMTLVTGMLGLTGIRGWEKSKGLK